MIVDKIIPFYTDEDRASFARYDREQGKVLEDAGALTAEMRAAMQDDDGKRLDALAGQSMKLWLDRYQDIESQRVMLLEKIEERYIDSFSGNIDAILEDIRDIVAAIEKEDYLKYQKRLTERLRPLLERKPDKTSPESEREQHKHLKALAVKGYSNCRFFIGAHIRVQINALQEYKSDDGIDAAYRIVEEKTREFYKEPKGLIAEQYPIVRALPIIKGADTRGDLLTLPSGPTLDLVYNLLSIGDMDRLLSSKSQYNHGQKYSIEQNGDKRRISYTANKSTTSIEIDDIKKIATRNPQTMKILTRILLRANEQAIHGGTLTKTRVSFPLRELVGEGQYKNLETARQGFYNATGTLVGIKVSGKIERGKTRVGQGAHEVFFTGAHVDNATCEIFLNDRLNWGLITPYYTWLPDYYFELPDRAAILLDYIFYLARMNSGKIAHGGSFNIGFRAIQARLNLPNEVQKNGKPINNPRRDIKDAIENAVSQIEERNRKYSPAGAEPEFSLLLLEDYDAPIKKYLDEGALQVTLKGNYAKRFIEIAQKTASKASAAQRKQERIETLAKAKALAKSIENN